MVGKDSRNAAGTRAFRCVSFRPQMGAFQAVLLGHLTGDGFLKRNESYDQGGINVITDIFGVRCQLTEYDPWGKVSYQDGNCDPKHRFTGKELDEESGLYYYGARYYDPNLMRFVSPDPFVQEPGNPQNFNRYSYTLNNPQKYVDPSGHFFGLIFSVIFSQTTASKLWAASDPIGFLLSKIPKKANGGITIFGGVAMMLTGNPAGALVMASGAMSFAKGTGFQIASQVLGIAGMIGDLYYSYGTASSTNVEGCATRCSERGGIAQQPGESGVPGEATGPQEVTDNRMIVNSKTWYETRTHKDLSLMQTVYAGGTTSNAEIKSTDPTTLYFREDLLSKNVSDENRYGTLFHEYVHYGSMSKMGVKVYFDKVNYFNNLGLTGGANPWERVAEFRGAELATEYLRRPVRPSPLYNVDHLR